MHRLLTLPLLLLFFGCSDRSPAALVAGTWDLRVVGMDHDCSALPAGILGTGGAPLVFNVTQTGSTIAAQFNDPAGYPATLAGSYGGSGFRGQITVNAGGRTLVFEAKGWAESLPNEAEVDGWFTVVSDTSGLCVGAIVRIWGLIRPVTGPNLPPTLSLLEPDEDDTVPAGTSVLIRYEDDDSDDVATTDIFADRDGDLATTADQVAIATRRPDQDGATQDVMWNTGGVAPGVYFLIGRTTDGEVTVTDTAAGRVTITAPPPTATFARRAARGIVHTIAAAGAEFTITGSHANPVTFGAGEPNETTFTSAGGYVARYDNFGDLRWAKEATSSDLVNARSVACFADGSCVATGSFRGSLTFDATTINTGSFFDVWRARFDAAGNLVWLFSDGGGATSRASGESVATFADGSHVIAGNFLGSVPFGAGGPNATTLNGVGDQDVFLARYNADGSFAWARSAGGTDVDTVEDVATFADGSTVIVGWRISTSITFGAGEANETTHTGSDFTELFLAKYNADGTLAWARQVLTPTDSSDRANAVAALADGSFVVTGNFSGTTTFGFGDPNQTTLTARFNSSETYVARYNGDGTLVWVRQAGGLRQNSARGIVAASDGSCIISGSFNDSMSFGPGEATETTLTATGREIFFAGFGADGSFLWARRAGGTGDEEALDVGLLADGTVVGTGNFRDLITFDAGGPGETMLTAQTNVDIWITRFNANGDY